MKISDKVDVCTEEARQEISGIPGWRVRTTWG